MVPTQLNNSLTTAHLLIFELGLKNNQIDTLLTPFIFEVFKNIDILK